MKNARGNSGCPLAGELGNSGLGEGENKKWLHTLLSPFIPELKSTFVCMCSLAAPACHDFMAITSSHAHELGLYKLLAFAQVWDRNARVNILKSSLSLLIMLAMLP